MAQVLLTPQNLSWKAQGEDATTKDFSKEAFLGEPDFFY